MKKVKHVIVLIVWFSCISFVLAANKPSELQKWVEQGNSLYQNEKYDEAILAYNKAIDTNLKSAEVYFNLANAHYKLKQIAPAIFNYEMALQLDPNDEEIITNLKYAQQMTIDEINEIPKVGFSQMIKSFVFTFEYDTWAWIGIFSLFAMLCAFIGYYFGYSVVQKRLYFIFIFVFLGISLLAIISGFKNKYILENEIYAIIFSEKVIVKSEPKLNSDEAFILNEGTKVEVKETNNTWTKIQIVDGKQGWILDKDIKKLK